jgi:hypothetical protein
MKTILLKTLYGLSLLCLFSTIARAQYMVGNKEVDTTFNHRVNFIFGALEANRVPYGLLRDYAMEFTALSGYNGAALADSNLVNKRLFFEIYNTLVSARIHSSANATLPDPGYADSIWFTKRQHCCPKFITSDYYACSLRLPTKYSI